ncbi:hypothetical protein AAIB41_15275 [Brucella sp. BE17]|uniref:hypothetical protein n=1 Tax=Brucella sp. BE17 TaxID=3142977 RepID=UPI0031BA49EA
MRGIVDDLVNGVSAADAFANALGRIADKLLDMAFDDLFTGIFKGSGGGGGFFSGLIPGFARGTNSAPRGVALVGEKGPELVRFRGGEQVIPNHRLTAPTMPILSSPVTSQQAQNGVIADVRVYVDQDGNWKAEVERISQRNVKQGFAARDKGSAVRTANDLRQVAARGYTR